MFKRFAKWASIGWFAETAKCGFHDEVVVGNRAGFWVESTKSLALSGLTLMSAISVPAAVVFFLRGPALGSVMLFAAVAGFVSITHFMHTVVSPAASVEVARELGRLARLRACGRVSRRQARKVRAHLRGADRELAAAREALDALEQVRVAYLDSATAEDVLFERRVRSEQVAGLVASIKDYSASKGIDPDYERSAAYEQAAVALRASRTAAANMAGVPLQARAGTRELTAGSPSTYSPTRDRTRNPAAYFGGPF